MLGEFELIKHHFSDNNDLHIYPISDVHLGAAEHMTREWELFCLTLKNDPNAYILLGGDMINNSTRTSVGSGVYTDVMRPREQKKIMCKMLEPLADRILACVSGNHCQRSSKDVDEDIMYDIMCKLDLEHLYRESMAFIKVQIGNIKGDGKSNPTYSIMLSHGAGGGMLTGSAVNRVERFGYAIDGVDLVVTGHTHKPFVTQPAKIKVDLLNNKVSVKPFKCVTATSWLNYGGYAAQKMLTPSSYAPQVITLGGKCKDIKVTM